MDTFRKRKNISRRVKRMPNRAGGALSRIVVWFKNLSNARKILLVVALVFIVMFAQSVIQQGEKKEEVAQAENQEEKLAEAVAKIDEAKSALVYKNEEGAREFLSKAQLLLAEIPQDVDFYQEKVVPKIQEVEAKINEVNHIISIEEPKIAADFTAIHTNLELAAMQINGEEILVFDKNDGSVYVTTNGTSESSTLLSNPDKEKATFKTAGDNGKIYTLNNSKTVGLLNTETKTITDVTLGSGPTSIDDMHPFSSRMYTLSSGDKQIFKHNAAGAGFGAGEKWISDAEVDISKGTSIFIDGSIYVLQNDGTIVKLFSGSKDNEFKQATLEPQLTSAEKITGTVEGNNIFVLDASNKRVVVLSKTGELVRQYRSERFANARDIQVNEAESLLYVLSGKQVYEIDIKNTPEASAESANTNTEAATE